ncbi:zf-TFIIB domain-containing protein [Garciella nitratireducens]|uniref:Zn-finger containing protein n=1 Tax=Garciella nitratireducens DSM 15102 TaxID=1121911 RepID=A0A1T4P1M6_9FIRM|nr:zf-TFIIB domain-containing protein [Garciella nitratireducens]RBP36161.1 hypothetical protein DFR81_1325 [Garciella nitratireducens]SJZ85510.1 hypothetical protein SAMN02745973_01896 [Garciella nitratireducens DSM 15102]
MNWLQKFMYGRYGWDALSIGLIVVYFIFIFIYQITLLKIFYVLSLFFIIYALFRIFSKNHTKRYHENAKFLKFWNPIQNWFKNKYLYFKGKKTYRYYKCPKCRQTLRIPKGSGKVIIRCPKCNIKFTKRVK